MILCIDGTHYTYVCIRTGVRIVQGASDGAAARLAWRPFISRRGGQCSHCVLRVAKRIAQQYEEIKSILLARARL